MKYILNKSHFKIPDSVLIKDIRKTAKKYSSLTLSRVQYNLEGTFNPSTIRHRFGSWNSALELAGLKIQKIPFITTEQLMHNLKQVWDLPGRQPLIREMKLPCSAYGVTAYVKRFGSWQKALKAFIKYQKTHKGKKPVLKAVYRKIKKSSKKNLAVNLSLRYKILKRDNFKCRLCGTSPAIKPGVILHIDHIIPVVKNGETIAENLQTLCSNCNYGKGALTPQTSSAHRGRLNPSPLGGGKSKKIKLF
jgi:5-methylcytosine-specific restriction endonuclease McrA